MKPQEPFKGVVANRSMKGSIVVVLNIRNDFSSSAWMFGTTHFHDMHHHHVDHRFLPISLEWKEIDLDNLVPIIGHKLDQKVPRNQLS